MIQKLKLITFILLLFPAGSIFGEDLPKCDPALEYWYNFYYDPEALKVKVDTISSSDTSKADESAIKPDTAVADSTANGKPIYKPTDIMAETLIQAVEVERERPLDIESVCIYFRDDEPYVTGKIVYQDAVGEIEALGVEITWDLNNRVTGDFPLSALPRLNALSSVKYIMNCARISPNSIEATSLDVSSHDKKDDIIYVPLYDSMQAEIEQFVKMYQNTYAISVIDDEYYISVSIETNGTFDEFDRFGIKILSRHGNSIHANIPIRMIARINSLESVRYIVFSLLVKLD